MRIASRTSRLGALVTASLVAGSVAGIRAHTVHGGPAVGWVDPLDQPPAGDFVFIRGGSNQGLGIRPDGHLVLWGGIGDTSAIAPLPASFDDEVFISCDISKTHLLGLTWDGRVITWDSQTSGELASPAPIRFTAVAAGGQHSLAIALDGTLRAWGNPALIHVPEGQFNDISARDRYSVAIRRDGTLIGWGVAPAIFATWTPDGDGHYYVAGERFTTASAGVDHVLALTINNHVLGWGANADGQLDAPAGMRFKAIAAGERYSLGIAVNGRLQAWGDNSGGLIDHAPTGRVEGIAAAAHVPFAILK